MIWLWTAFIVFVLVMLGLDLFVVNRKAHVVRSREAVAWTFVTVVLAVAFSGVVYVMYDRNWLGIAAHLTQEVHAQPYTRASIGREAMAQFITGWLTEYSLSLDNIFIIAVIFAYFRVPAEHQHRVLFWGILGALLMRGAMIGAGVALIERFHWMIYVLGGFLVLTALRMLITGDNDPEPERGLTVRLARRVLPITPGFEGDRFFTRHNGRRAVTPLFLVLLVVETTDVVFAVDSIPAIFSITTDPFLVFTSNVFAILGLRSLYFALAAFMGKFRYLKFSLVFVLAFVGVKMLLTDVHDIRTEYSLAVIVGVLAVGIGASLLASRRERTGRPAPVTDLADAAELAWRRSRRYVIFVIGCTVILFGLAIGWLPGPGGIPIVLAGLAILATEFVWAQRVLQVARRKAEAALRKQGPWLKVLGIALLVAGVAAVGLHGRWHVRSWWACPLIASGVIILGTELFYGRYLRRRAISPHPPSIPTDQRPPGAA